MARFKLWPVPFHELERYRMDQDQAHCIAGFFSDLAHAEATRAQLGSRGLPPERLKLFKGDAGEPVAPGDRSPQAGSDSALKDMLVDGAVGGAAGAGLGALAELALVASSVTLFVASPLLAPLALLGWGATVGATVGAMVGADKKEAPLSALIRDAVSQGQVVLVADTQTAEEAKIASDVIQSATHAHPSVPQA